MTPDEMPRCVCTAHPVEDTSRRQWMYVAEETPKHVVFCCRRCTEICRTAVIQVRSLGERDRAKYEIYKQRKQMDPRLLKMIQQRKRGRVTYRREDD